MSSRRRSPAAPPTQIPLPMAPDDWAQAVRHLSFSPRQAQIAALVMAGKRDKEILAILGGKRSSLRTQFSRAFARAGVDNRQALSMRIVAVAQQLGLPLRFDDRP